MRAKKCISEIVEFRYTRLKFDYNNRKLYPNRKRIIIAWSMVRLLLGPYVKYGGDRFQSKISTCSKTRAER